VILTNDHVNGLEGFMSYSTEVAIRSALIGIGATAIMDAWLMALKAMKVPILNCFKSLINHTVFGVGLYAAAVILMLWN